MISKLFRYLAVCATLGRTAGADAAPVRCDDFAWIPRGRFSFNNNVWNGDVRGEQCITVSSDSNAFNVTWQWERGNESEPVHSFPYVRFNSRYVPARLWDLQSLRVAAAWDMYPAGAGSASLNSTGTIANVAIDMFLDLDARNATDAKAAKFEVMIWFATYGGGSPFGRATGLKQTIAARSGQNATFELFDGTKTNGHRVLTWQGMPALFDFDADVLSFLRTLKVSGFLQPNLTLGVVEFGTETFYSNQSITFAARNFSMDLASNASVTSSASFPSSGPSRSTATKKSTIISTAMLQLGVNLLIIVSIFAPLW